MMLAPNSSSPALRAADRFRSGMGGFLQPVDGAFFPETIRR